MSEIKAVLLVPHEGDPHLLLKEGPCGARPPKAWLSPEGWQAGKAPTSGGRPMVDDRHRALVLAWDGKPVAEVQPYIERAGIDYALLAPFVAYALKGMDIGQGPWPGTLVLLDAEGQEVSDE